MRFKYSFFRLSRVLVALIVLISLSSTCAYCSDSTADYFSKSVLPISAIAELALFADGGRHQEATQGAKALVATAVAAELLKVTVREKRPNEDSYDSFPSAHTAFAFTTATVFSDYRPKYKWLAYGWAAGVGWSRVEKGEHTWGDVVAGAALGYFSGKMFTKTNMVVTGNGVEYRYNW